MTSHDVLPIPGDRRSEFIEGVVTQIVCLGDETNSEMAAIDVVQRPSRTQDGEDVLVTTLDPTDEQSQHAEQRTATYVATIEVLHCFLSRHAPTHAAALLQLAREFLSFVRFERLNVDPDMPEDVWRDIFGREVDSLVDRQVRLVRDSVDAFAALRTRDLPECEDIIVSIHRTGSTYRLELTSHVGLTADDVSPLPLGEVEKFRAVHASAESSYATSARRLAPAIAFGSALFDSVFSGRLRESLTGAVHDAAGEGKSIRLHLDFEQAPELMGYPWEFLYDGTDFLALSPNTLLVRRIQSRSVIPPRNDRLSPIRILMSFSSPSDRPLINVDDERERLFEALTPLLRLGVLSVDVCPDGTSKSLQRMLRNADLSGQPYHVWHHFGHGFYSDTEEASVLYFEDDAGMSSSLGGFELSTIFAGHPPLKLAVLNTCDAGRSGGSESTSGVALGLARRGIASVVAMQFPVAEESAVVFAEEFYAALGDGLPVDVALTEARRALFLAAPTTEWAAPVLIGSSLSATSFSFDNAIDTVLRTISALSQPDPI